MEAMDTSSPMSESDRDPLMEDFEAWAAMTNRNIQLKSLEKDEDGKASIKFTIEKGQTFTLHCPLHYPNYQVQS